MDCYNRGFSNSAIPCCFMGLYSVFKVIVLVLWIAAYLFWFTSTALFSQQGAKQKHSIALCLLNVCIGLLVCLLWQHYVKITC